MNECLCDNCTHSRRRGYKPESHYIPNKLSKLEKKIYKLRSSGKLKYLGSGRHRDTYLSPSGKYVIKFPNKKEGSDANKSERNIFTGKEKYDSFSYNTPYIRDRFAGCRLIGKNILIMTKVDTKIPEKVLYKKKNEWLYDIDCEQVGLHPDGRLVAYDYTNL